MPNETSVHFTRAETGLIFFPQGSAALYHERRCGWCVATLQTAHVSTCVLAASAVASPVLMSHSRPAGVCLRTAARPRHRAYAWRRQTSTTRSRITVCSYCATGQASAHLAATTACLLGCNRREWSSALTALFQLGYSCLYLYLVCHAGMDMMMQHFLESVETSIRDGGDEPNWESDIIK